MNHLSRINPKHLCRAIAGGIAIALITVNLLPQPARAANGDLDRTFGGYGVGGRTLGDPFPGYAITDSVATLDGKLIAVGSDDKDIVVTRYDADGKLDPTFGTNGVTTLDFNNQVDVAGSVAHYAAGKILVAGTTTFGPRVSPNGDFAVARLNADGSPDLTFSQDGKTTVDFNGRYDGATAVIPFSPRISSNGHMLVVGSVEQNPPGAECAPSCNLDFGILALTPNGVPDPTFDGDGKVQHDVGGDDVPLAVAGSIDFYVAGYRRIGTTSEYVIARYDRDGQILKSFNGTGYRTGSSPKSITDLAHYNEVIAIGKVGNDFGLLSFKKDGSLDPAWGNGGIATVDFGADDSPHALIPSMPDGFVTVTGTSGTRLAVARVTDRGQVVPHTAVTADFGDSGAASVRALTVAWTPDVQLQTIGSIQVGNTVQLAMMRHFLDGTPDDGGRRTTDFGNTSNGYQRHNDDRAQTAAFQPDGKLLVAGFTEPYAEQRRAALARYTAGGALDPSFDGDGRLILDNMPTGATGIGLQPDGKIIVAGNNFDVARLNPNGSPDITFNGAGYTKFNIANAISKAMVLQPDGKIVLAGHDSKYSTFIVARFTTGGLPDSSFGVNGIQQVGVGLQSAAYDVTIQPDSKLVVAGFAVVSTTDVDFALVRLNPGGSPDLSFDGDGKQTTDFGSLDFAHTVAVQPDGAIIAAGRSQNNGAALARYLPGGSPDPSFSDDGKLLLQVTGNDVARALDVSDSGITAAVCDQDENSGQVVRLTADGKPDSSINGNGRLPFRFGGTDCPYELASTAGRIAAVGYARRALGTLYDAGLSQDFAVAMYDNSVAAPVPTPTPTPTPSPSPTPVPTPTQPGTYTTYLPVLHR